jgi:hypothetical protein
MGPRVGSRWIVEQGLRAGDRVIVDAGQLAEGATVKTTPFVEPQPATAGAPTATPAAQAQSGSR